MSMTGAVKGVRIGTIPWNCNVEPATVRDVHDTFPRELMLFAVSHTKTLPADAIPGVMLLFRLSSLAVAVTATPPRVIDAHPTAPISDMFLLVSQTKTLLAVAVPGVTPMMRVTSVAVADTAGVPVNVTVPLVRVVQVTAFKFDILREALHTNALDALAVPAVTPASWLRFPAVADTAVLLRYNWKHDMFPEVDIEPVDVRIPHPTVPSPDMFLEVSHTKTLLAVAVPGVTPDVRWRSLPVAVTVDPPKTMAGIVSVVEHTSDGHVMVPPDVILPWTLSCVVVSEGSVFSAR
jgi:hypothetical protein